MCMNHCLPLYDATTKFESYVKDQRAIFFDAFIEGIV